MLPDITWDEVAARLRAVAKAHARMRPTVRAMLRLVAALRAEPALARVGKNVSHVSLVLWRDGAGRYVSIGFSEPKGIAWAGREGFVVEYLEPAELHLHDRVVVTDNEAAATILKYLEGLG